MTTNTTNLFTGSNGRRFASSEPVGEFPRAVGPWRLVRPTRLELLIAAVFFTDASCFAAKTPPPPPPPQPSSGTVVLDYDYAPGIGASLFGLTVAPSGMIYSSGESADWHGIVLA